MTGRARVGAWPSWRIGWAAVLLALLGLSGCAEVKYVMRLDPLPDATQPTQRWPAAPETPRYRYVGQLLGEENFVSDGTVQRNAGVKLFHWLVGLFDGSEEKLTLKRPQSGTVDAQGRILVTDISNHAVLVFDPVAGKLLVWGQAQAQTNFVTPIGIAMGAGGQVLVADAELGRVFRLDQEGKPLGSFGQGVLTRPTGLARDATLGRVYVSDTHAHDIKVFDDAGGLLEIIGQRGEGPDELNFPTHLAFSGGKLYVADSMNARVQVFDTQGGASSTIGRRGRFVGNLSRPKGVAVDGRGHVYVVESFYDNLLVFDGAGNFLMPIGGTGKEVGQFYLPAGVWSDARGRIYVADMFNGRVVIFQFLGAN
ncbi:6-bladed beta-propeller [Rhodoferax sp.]|uniref:6-bladed beta-propeller n=1 Tax=Rhodoferax sp. TaxID=50421 RepID=UPI0027564921|nr:6-bladed beta-propeller [Rhodoferax sp.]